ncbi:unnamed protein product [Rotaria magnacalcarata]|uniref:Uncharacterized protein n=3 Tax=Rotaria magnacalcarata TaxID=392030 RepID=A0A820UEB7_9BILA|nr:unnamed protein product [Rotaria magnacalcarata]
MKDRESSVRSNLFYGAISSSEFLCSFPILNKLLSFTTNVARSLPNSKIDLMTCISNIEDILQGIQMKRNEPDEEYKYLFEEAQDLAKYTETIIKMPRVVKRQINRDNIPASSAYEYFKLNIFIPLLDHFIVAIFIPLLDHFIVAIFIPLLDHFIVAIKDRFSEHVKKAAAISCLIPEHIADKSYDDLLPAIELYQKFLHCSTAQLKTEFVLWKKRWTDIVTEDSFTSLSSYSGSNPNTVNMKRKEQVFLPDK